MAKKKSKIPAYVLKQFDRALYKVGDKVVITWLGQIKQGHVTKFKKTNWGVSYTVDVAQESTKARNQITRYPCGIQIKEHTTDYDVGLILHDRTQAGDFPADTGIYGYSGSGENESRNDDSSSTRVRNSNTEIRSLDKAIDRQRDFLNGFVKK